LEKYVSMVGNPEQDKLRDASRAYYLLGQNLRRLGREQEARSALTRSQQIREAKFKYDVKHIFAEKNGQEDDSESRVSDRVADLLQAGSPEDEQHAQTMIQQGLPASPAPRPTAAGKETAATSQSRSYVGDMLG